MNYLEGGLVDEYRELIDHKFENLFNKWEEEMRECKDKKKQL